MYNKLTWQILAEFFIGYVPKIDDIFKTQSTSEDISIGNETNAL